nr:unnamed protein product [Callosobruchus analis]
MRLLQVLVALALSFGPMQAAPAGCGCTNVVITPSEQSCLLGHLLQIITTLVNNQDPKCTKELMRNLTRSCPDKPSSTTPKLWKWEEPNGASRESVEVEPETNVNKPVPIPLPIPIKPPIKEPVSEPEPELSPKIETEPKPDVDEKPGAIIKPPLLPIPLPPILTGSLAGPIFKKPETDVKPEAEAEASPTTEPVTEAATEPVTEHEEPDSEKLEGAAVSEPETTEQVTTTEPATIKESDAKAAPSPLWPPVLPSVFGVPLPGLLPPTPVGQEPALETEDKEAAPETITTTQSVVTTEVPQDESNSEVHAKPAPFPLLPPVLPPIFGGPLPGLVPPTIEEKSEEKLDEEAALPEVVTTTEPAVITEIGSESKTEAEPAEETDSEANPKPIPFPLLPPALPPIFGSPFPGLVPPAPVAQKPELKTEEEEEKAAPKVEPQAETELESDSEAKQQPMPFPLFPPALPLPKPGGIFGIPASKPEEVQNEEVPVKSDSDESPESKSESATKEEHEHVTEPVSDESSASEDKDSDETDEVTDEQNETTTTQMPESTESDETTEDTQSDTEETTEVSTTPKPESTTESAETEEVASEESLEKLMKKKDEILAHAHKLLDEAHEMLKLPDKIRAEALDKIKNILPGPEEPDEVTSSERPSTTESPQTTPRETTEGVDSSEEKTTTDPLQYLQHHQQRKRIPPLFPPIIKPTAVAEPTPEVTESDQGTQEVGPDSLEDVAKPIPSLFPALPPLFPPLLKPAEPVIEDEKPGADSIEPAPQPIPPLFPPLPLPLPGSGDLSAPKEEDAAVSDDSDSIKPDENEAAVPEKPLFPSLFPPIPPLLPPVANANNPEENEVEAETSLPETTEAVVPTEPAVPEETEALTEIPEKHEASEAAPKKTILPSIPSLFPPFPPLIPAPISPVVGEEPEKVSPGEEKEPEITEPTTEPNQEEAGEVETVKPEATEEVPTEAAVRAEEPQLPVSSFFPSFGNLFTGGQKPAPPALLPPLGNIFTPKEPKEEEDGEALESLSTTTEPCDLTTSTPAVECSTILEPKIITSVAPPLLPPLGNLFTPESTEGKDSIATSTMQCDLSTTEPCSVTPYTDLPKIDSASPKIEVPEIHAEIKATEGPKEDTPNMDETFNTAVESTTKAMCEHKPMKYPHTLFIPVLKFDETPAYTADELLEYVYNMYKSPKHGLRIDQSPLIKNHEHHKY